MYSPLFEQLTAAEPPGLQVAVLLKVHLKVLLLALVQASPLATGGLVGLAIPLKTCMHG